VKQKAKWVKKEKGWGKSK